MSDDAHLLEHRVGGELLHDGWLDLRRDTVRLPDGTTTTREYIRHSGAVAVVALLDDDATTPQLVLVRQFRYPVAKVLVELPAGKLDAGETQLQCAMRELREETGYAANEWAYGGELHNAPAYSDESIWIWFARGLVGGPTQLDAGEFVETVTMRSDALLALSLAGDLPDVKTLVGLAWLQQVLAGLRTLQWQAAPANTASERRTQ